MSQENVVSLKLPTFWTSEPHIWFAQAEAQLNIRGITADETKYYDILSALDQGIATSLLDLIQRPPTENKYSVSTSRLINTFGLSEQE